MVNRLQPVVLAGFLVSLFTLVSVVLPASAAETLIPVTNGGFESPGAAAPLAWTTTGEGGGTVSRDTSVHRSGGASLLIENDHAALSTVSSEPLDLEVGRFYRLTGYIRTENAVANPESRYPTPVPACISMSSFPFTNHSPAASSTQDWTRVEVVFAATTKKDRVQLHLGRNGAARGKAWFDDLSIESVEKIEEVIPWETIRFAGKGYRYDDRGWIFVHVEGEPHTRGVQFGTLVWREIAAYIQKLANQENQKDPVAGWNSLRVLTDALMLRKFEEEYLAEMQGIAAGAARAGARFESRPVDLLDIATLNSVIDLGQMTDALKNTPSAVSGKSFLSAEEELSIPNRQHKCSSFAATGPATADGRIVFGQIFMWGGYTGVHFNILLDLVPARGNRVVFQTFPGGIHSGTDFYINSAGLIAGETTVNQTPFESSGTPQSNRIRKAMQYGNSVDEFARILGEKNNGLYTNDWPVADIKTNEAAIFLLGTKKSKLWRSTDKPAPFGTPGFLWANNNNRDLAVRSEHAVQPNGAPFDIVFSPWNRDVAFRRFYDSFKGKIDAGAAVNLWASSPINRPHACDGKVTTSEMAEKLVFLAHQGKVTLREKFPGKENRRFLDLPGATPHLTYGYATASPIAVTRMIEEARARRGEKSEERSEPSSVDAAVKSRFEIDKRQLWRGTISPAAENTNWLVSGGAAYWQILNGLPEQKEKVSSALGDQLAEINNRLLYRISREGDLEAASVTRVYDRYAPYQIPRIKGTFALHQLRLLLGNELFFRLMRDFYARNPVEKPVLASSFVAEASRVSGKDIAAFLAPWIDRKGLPSLSLKARYVAVDAGFTVTLDIRQEAALFHLFSSVEIETEKKRTLFPIEFSAESSTFEFHVAEKPVRLVLNPGRDFPVSYPEFYAFSNFSDDFEKTRIVYGASRQVEANHTLALRFQTVLADAFSEVLPTVQPDWSVTKSELSGSDLILLGPPSDNALLERIAKKLPVEFEKGLFRFRGRTYAAPDDGVFLALANPWNPSRFLLIFAGNSPLALHALTKMYRGGLGQWAILTGDEIKLSGSHEVDSLSVTFGGK